MKQNTYICTLLLLTLLSVVLSQTAGLDRVAERVIGDNLKVSEQDTHLNLPDSQVHREEYGVGPSNQATVKDDEPHEIKKVMKKYYELDFNLYNICVIGASIVVSLVLILAMQIAFSREQIAKFDYLLVTGGSKKTKVGGMILITYITMFTMISGGLLFYWFRQYPREPHFIKNDPTLRNNFPLNFNVNMVLTTSNKLSYSEDEQKACKDVLPNLKVSPGLEYANPSLTCKLNQVGENSSEYVVTLSFKNEPKPQALTGQTLILETNRVEGTTNLKWQMQMTNKFNANGLYGPNTPIRHQIKDEKEEELKAGLPMESGRFIAKIQMTPMNYDNHIEEIHYKTYKPELLEQSFEASDKNIIEIEFAENEYRRYDFVQPHSSFGQTCSYLVFLFIIGMFFSEKIKGLFKEE